MRAPTNGADHAAPDEPIASLIAATSRAKRVASGMYANCEDRAPGLGLRLMVGRIAAEEAAHAAMLDRLGGSLPAQPATPSSAPAVGCGLGDETWASALMAAFALDQAATAALLALTRAADPTLAQTAQQIVDEERAHQSFALGAFRALADRDRDLGRQLASEMIEARDWVKQVYPRRQALGALADAGLLPTEAPRAHDSFLASLGDRIQEALGVLGG